MGLKIVRSNAERIIGYQAGNFCSLCLLQTQTRKRVERACTFSTNENTNRVLANIFLSSFCIVSSLLTSWCTTCGGCGYGALLLLTSNLKSFLDSPPFVQATTSSQVAFPQGSDRGLVAGRETLGWVEVILQSLCQLFSFQCSRATGGI